MRQKLRDGKLDHLLIEIEVSTPPIDISNSGNIPPEMANVQESIIKVISGINKKGKKKEVSIKDAKEMLKQEASSELFDEEKLKDLAIKKIEEGGIVFIDEIDKIAVPSNSNSRQDPSKEGVQRDLLPIVEGSTVQTRVGAVNRPYSSFI